MIVKMKFLSISGPQTDIDRVSNVYLSKYEMQLENAITELKTTDNLMPFMDVNPYREPLAKAEQYVEMLPDKTVPMDWFAVVQVYSPLCEVWRHRHVTGSFRIL